MIQDCQRLNWFTRSTMVRTISSTADLATRSECAESMPLTDPYIIPRSTFMRGLWCPWKDGVCGMGMWYFITNSLVLPGVDMSFSMRAPRRVTATITAVPAIHSRNGRRPSNASSWSRVCAGSPIAPKMPIMRAPIQTRIVPKME